MSRLEELCSPLILLVCDYYNSAKAGAPIDPAELRNKIQNQLDDIRHKSEDDPQQKRGFQKLEQPIVFFIDYVIKEGKFPFSKSWEPIARSYQELSGDEKFFDLLTENLDDPDASECLRVFYLLMGLGFDGCYKKDKEYVARRMKLCALRCDVGKPLTPETLCRKEKSHKIPKRYRLNNHSRQSFICVIVCLALLLIAASWNFYKYKQYTQPFYQTLKETSQKLSVQIMQNSSTPAQTQVGR